MRLVQHLVGDVEDFYKTGIYKISFADKPEYAYIGSAFAKRRKTKSSGGIYMRLSIHLGQLKKNKHRNKYLQSVFNKYKSSIQFEILEILTTDLNRDKIESFWIESYRSSHKLLNLTSETTVNGRLKPLSKEVLKRTGAIVSKALKGKIPANLNNIHKQSRRRIEEYSLSGDLQCTYNSLKEFSDHYDLTRGYCSFYLRRGNSIPRIKDKVFKYLASEINSERAGLKFRVIDEKANEFVMSSLNNLSIFLKTKPKTLNAHNVQSKAIIFNNYIVCPIIKPYTSMI